MLKLDEIRIARRKAYSRASENNPFVATVTAYDVGTTVKTELTEEATQRLLDVIAEEVVTGAEEQMKSFVANARAIDGPGSVKMIGDEVK